MTFKTRELTVDLVNEISTKEIRFSQGDRNSAKLVLNITNEGQELDLSQAKAVRITFKKPDGTTVFQEDLEPINAMKGKYQIILKTQTLAAAGNVYGQVRIFEKDQELDAEPFGFTVKQSYSGDGAVESTNEFTIIQKAIEAGEKLEGVDINGIIAAGAKADAALPKAGGTMTGDVNFNPDKGVGFNSGGTTKNNYLLKGQGTQNKIALQDKTSGKWIWEYNSDTGTFSVLSDTNVYKKTDIYGAFTQYDGRAFNITGQDLNTIVQAGQYSGQNMLNTPSGVAASSTFYYIEVVKHLSVNYAKQIATTLATTTPTTWIRTMNNGVWGDWIQQIDSRGGSVTGNFKIDRPGAANYRWLTWATAGVDDMAFGMTASGTFILQDVKNNRNVLSYDPATQAFTLFGASNLLKNTGGEMTGTLKLGTNSTISQEQHKRTANAKGLFYTDEGLTTTVAGIGRYVDETGQDYIYLGHGSSPWNSTGGLKVSQTEFKYKGKDVAMRDKDGQVDLVVTADGTAFDTNTPNVARRRGNTVTLRIALRRNVGSTDSIVATIPADMRPSTFMVTNAIATDGTVSRLTVEASGNIKLTATGKDVYATITYVVD